MRDQRILDLVQMASEAEELEQSARLTFAHTPAETGMSWRRVGVLGALAAVLTMAFMVWPRAPIPGPPQVVMNRPKPVAPKAPEQVNTGPMLLAVFHQPDARCDCVVWEEGSFANRDVREIGRSELIEAAWKARCADSSNLMLVVALDGPRELLPTDEDSARVLAACLSIQSEECGAAASCYENASEFISPSVTMVAATLATTGK
ncbi:hypothetical protein PHYC_01180 [Phycisphaerales bacterium]|nr:hypothetical protein PHYC_01180 [Phycisphaerales bacterium]